MDANKIIWTKTDEAPALATYSLLPIVQAYTRGTGVEVETRDISLAGRILANFPEKLTAEQQVPDALTELGELAKTPAANIIKLPNISASIPQLQDAIDELKAQGFDVPNYPEEANTETKKALRDRFAKVLGSAVNPVLREGNADRRAALSVKKFAQKNPHKMMKDWPTTGSQARIAHMNKGDFYGSEKSVTMPAATTSRIEFVSADGVTSLLKEGISLQSSEVVDTSVMNLAALRAFYTATIAAAKKDGVLLSLHLKATMMKISDPIIFGVCVSVYYAAALEKHAAVLAEIGANVDNGLAGVLDKLDKLPAAKKAEIEADIEAVYATQPALAMVDSRKGITNLHVPNNIIVDASIPNVVRDGGRMWNNDNELQDTVAIVPDRCYATMYQACILDCQKNGQFDPATMGSVANVGLMAQKAEEYGSHDKTFTASGPGTMRVVGADGSEIMAQPVEAGDIFRMCQAKDEPIADWVKLAVNRAKATGSPTIFWLDKNRSHDAQIMKKVNQYLPAHDTTGLEIEIMDPVAAMEFTLKRTRAGKNTIAVTGNVLRDYLTDLFPILELGTSARMLSIVPLLNGGGLFETGAGGSAPKHVQQFLTEGHLRWDSLGEYCALVPSLEMIAEQSGNAKASLLASTLDDAVSDYLENSRNPSRKVNEIDNRGSTFYLAMYWAQALAAQDQDSEMKNRFTEVARTLTENEDKICSELLAAQGAAVDIGGYFHSDDDQMFKAMRPSATFNGIVDGI